MKKILLAVLAALLILTMSACVNIDGDLGEALSQVDMNELYEHLHVEEMMDQMGISDMISQLIPQAQPTEAPEVPEEAETDAENMHFKTIGEAMDGASDWVMCGRGTPSYYTFVFYLDDVPYRVSARLDEELTEKFDEIDMLDSHEEIEKESVELARTLPIDIEEDLSKYYPDQETLDQYIGKTGKELEDLGFSICGYNNDNLGEYMEVEKGLFTYAAFTNEPFGDEDSDRYGDFYNRMTVKELKRVGLSFLVNDLFYTD